MADYNFTVRNHYQPFSMQEMLTPFLMYNEAYEKVDEAYTELQRKADVFSNLAKSLPGQSKAAEIYNGYANDLRAQAEDLAKNGLSMNNRRALSSLKRRYEGEIGRLDRANTTFQEVLKARRAAELAGKPMLYATNNLGIDNFLDNESPNMYGINSDDLYTRGAAAGKAASSRIISVGDGGSTLGGYYRDWIRREGYSPESINAFRQNASAIPELQATADAILRERGVYANLTGIDLARAQQSVINGIIDGAVYSETHDPKRDVAVPTPLEMAQEARAQESHAWQRAKHQMDVQDWIAQRVFDENGNLIGFKTDDVPPGYVRDPRTGQLKIARDGSTGSKGGKKGGSSESGKGSSTQHYSLNKEALKISWKGNNPKELNGEADDDYEVTPIDASEDDYAGKLFNYDQLPQYVKDKVNKAIGPSGNTDYYRYHFKDFKRGKLWGLLNDTEAELVMVPRDDFTSNADAGEEGSYDLTE